MIEKRRILVVSKDHGGGFVACQFARFATERGHEVLPVVEGLAAQYFWRQGVPTIFQGTVNHEQFPFTLDVSRVMETLKPDVVVVTLGAPINLEAQFATAANAMKVPLVFLTDCAGGEVRSDALPQMVLTVDAFGSDLANKSCPGAAIHVVGHPGVPALEEVGRLLGTKRFVTQSVSGVRTYAYVGGSPDSTTQQLRLLMECLGRTNGKWELFTRFHPKFKDLPSPVSGKTYGQFWLEILSPLGDRVRPCPIADAKEFVASVDVTLADWSTLLYTAVCCGKTAIFLETPEVIEGMKKETGSTQFPLVEMGCARTVSRPQDLSEIQPPLPSLVRRLKPYDPYSALIAVENLLAIK